MVCFYFLLSQQLKTEPFGQVVRTGLGSERRYLDQQPASVIPQTPRGSFPGSLASCFVKSETSAGSVTGDLGVSLWTQTLFQMQK